MRLVQIGHILLEAGGRCQRICRLLHDEEKAKEIVPKMYRGNGISGILEFLYLFENKQFNDSKLWKTVRLPPPSPLHHITAPK